MDPVDAEPVDAQPDTADAAPDARPADPGQFTVLAGNTATGFADGVGAAARLSGVTGAAIAPDGKTLYLADTFNNLIRAVDVDSGEVTTLAGRVQVVATVDGVGPDALFQSPRAMAITADGGALYIADGTTLRRMDIASREVVTVAGVPGMSGYQDGIGDAARLGSLLHSLALSADDATVYIADRSNEVVRALDVATREVTSVAGAPYTDGPEHVDGTGAEVRFSGLGGLVRVGDALYITDTFNQCIRRLDLATLAVTTVAGDPAAEGNDDGAGVAATFSIPQNLAGDGTYLYVTGFSGVLRRVRLGDFTVDTLLGVPDQIAPIDGDHDTARLGVAFGPPLLAPSGRTLYFNDRSVNSVRVIDLDALTVHTLAGAAGAQGAIDGELAASRFAAPEDIACTADGTRCFISDTGNHTIRVLDRTTAEVSTLAGQPGVRGAIDGVAREARFTAPVGLALDEAGGVLYVADSGNHAIRAVDLGDAVVTTIAGLPGTSGAADGALADARFNRPYALALAPGRAALYLSDRGNATVRVVDLGASTVSTLAGSAGMTGSDDGKGPAARFRSPVGVALAADGATLYVADSGIAHTIRAIDIATAMVTTLAGQPGQRGIADGPFAEALFYGPADLFLDSGGALYAADRSNHVVRRLDLEAGVVSTWLGDVVRHGLPAPGIELPWSDATLYFPSAIAVSGAELLILGEDAVLLARPPETP